jgi:hypothetical protein
MEVEKRARDEDYDEDVDINNTPLKKQCIIELNENIRTIPVGGKYSEKFGGKCYVSAEDFDTLSKYKWRFDKNGYVSAHITKRVCMSRFLLNPKKHVLVDHVDGCRYNNTRQNLRLVTHKQNSQNRRKKPNTSSRYVGVRPENDKYRAVVNGIRLGSFESEIKAAEAYDTYVVQNRDIDGLKNNLNFPEKEDYYKTLSIIVPAKPKKSATDIPHILKFHGKFKYQFMCKRKRYSGQGFDTAIEAAKAADKRIVENKLDKKLNFPEDYPEYVPEKEQKSFITEIDMTNPAIKKVIEEMGCVKEIDIERDILVKLSNTNNSYTLMERNDFDLIKQYRLRRNDSGYASLLHEKHDLLHRFLLKCDDLDFVVDHIFSARLDNRRRFLRAIPKEQNVKNRLKSKNKLSSSFIGVHYEKRKNRFRAAVCHKGKRILERLFLNEEDAARLRDLCVMHYFPTQYKLNFEWNTSSIMEWREKLNDKITWNMDNANLGQENK